MTFSDPELLPGVEGNLQEIPQEGIELQPGKLYLGHTEEMLGSRRFASSLIGRSTLGRLGLWLQVTADLGHTGTYHRWTLEMKVVQPLRVYAGMPIGQICFWRVRGARNRYVGKYRGDMSVMQSRLL